MAIQDMGIATINGTHVGKISLTDEVSRAMIKSVVDGVSGFMLSPTLKPTGPGDYEVIGLTLIPIPAQPKA